jgi:tRNA(fMet)-specific endonuclease VapC
MPVRHFLDTNMASYAIKGNVPHVRQRLFHRPMVEVGISVITEAELRFGVAHTPGHSRLETAVQKLLPRVEILRWDSAVAKCYASLRYAVEPTGDPMGNLDTMIAAQALSAPTMLVTLDMSAIG